MSHETCEITHHIAPDIDAERYLLIGDLNSVGRNSSGDPYFTDRKVLIVVLVPHK